ncbi:diaminopimelate decarboxylase [Amycolatopsis xylanica]|uniref:Diaminopimelate decarboxylase n=1 Tax=Amycolatopsis xylanica TaxID=589385 RepID=A0A1H3S2J3_9PSEU|nr:diaminopimelate decarboxylase [Amycolatopsis xylanica]SDZ31701.1 diaminopimelate decarboxylase [Amycolatopsis xylanica]
MQRVERRNLAVQAAVKQGLLDQDDAPLAAFVDLAGIAESVSALRSAWPDELQVRHAFAAKANPIVPVLRELRKLGMSCEVASAGELAQARAAGFRGAELVFDSPAKSRRELEQALAEGVAINIDNFQELARVDDILSLRSSTSDIGIRINPQTGSGSIEALSTASRTSKFGIALDDEGNRTTLLEAYLARPWLRWMHVHVGSQGVPLRLTARGVARVVEFAEEINARAGVRQVTGIDVGGGLSVNFGGDDDSPRFHDHVAELMAAAPALFRGGYQVVTEFGRSLLAKNGFIAARVEYTKSAGGRRIAITHAGSQVAMRTTMVPEQWPLRVAAYDQLGRPRLGTPVKQDIAGPCCFAGDLVAGGRGLPLLEQGDIVTLLDTGAYYFSAPYRYNSLPEPAVHGFDLTEDGDVAFTLLRRAETVEELIGR